MEPAGFAPATSGCKPDVLLTELRPQDAHDGTRTRHLPVDSRLLDYLSFVGIDDSETPVRSRRYEASAQAFRESHWVDDHLPDDVLPTGHSLEWPRPELHRDPRIFSPALY